MQDSLNGKRALVYTRRSTDKQSDSSNEQQEALLRGYAARHGMTVVDVHHSRGVSASNTEKRDDLEHLLVRAESERSFDVLLIQTYDRLTRGGARHGGYLIHRFAQVNVRVVSASHDIPDSDLAPVIEAFEFWQGRIYAKSLAFNTTRGALASIFDGRAAYCRTPPFGVDRLILDSTSRKLFRIRNLPGGEQVKLRWDTDEELERYPRNEKNGPFRHFVKRKEERIVLVNGDPEHVRLMREMMLMHYVKRIGFRTITMWLNDLGVMTVRGNSAWAQCTVTSMLRNPVYTGRGVCNRLAWGEYQNRSSSRDQEPLPARKGRRAERLRSPTEWVFTSLPEIDIVPAELREQVWQEQKAALVRRAEYGERVREVERAKREGRVPADAVAVREIERNTSRPNSQWPLVRAIFERESGQPMTGYRCGPLSTHRYYFLPKHRTNPSSEDRGRRKFFPAAATEGAVIQTLCAVLGDLQEHRDAVERYVRENVQAAHKDVGELENLRQERDRHRQKKAFALDQFQDLGPDLLAAKIAPLTAAIRELDGRIAAAERQTGASPEVAEHLVASIMQTLADVKATLGDRNVCGAVALLKVEQVAEMLGISKRTVWRLVSGKQLPQPVSLGRAKRWRQGDIEGFVNGLSS